jgi:ribosomal protein S18 acetylase RimI-like enzyme
VNLDVDLDAVFKVAYACELDVVDDPDTTREDIHNLIKSPDADLINGTRVATDEAGSIVGFISLEVDRAGHEIFADAYVVPGQPDSTWDQLLQHAGQYAEAVVAALPADERPGWVLGGGSYSSDQRYSAVLRRAGMTTVRRFHTMAIGFDPTKPPEPPQPLPGVELSIVGEDEQLSRTAHALWSASFSEHWRFVTRPYDEFMTHSRSRSFDPTQWWIASVDGVPAGVCLGNDHLAELGWGYVSTLGVLAEFRGRGMARLLLEAFFVQAYERGRVGVKLGVDTENHTGAPALYASVGMTPSRVIDAWERALS